MKTFREFANDKDVNAIKYIIISILDTQQDTIDPKSHTIMSRPLADFKNKENLLTDPAMLTIINQRKNRGAITAAINANGTTIGNLIAMLSDGDKEKEPEFLG